MERNQKIIIFFALFCIFINISVGQASSSDYASSHKRQSHEELEAYWTPERMRNAVPHDLVREGNPDTETSARFEREETEQVFVDGKDSIVFPSAIEETNETELVSHAKRAYPFPYTAGYAPSYTSAPWRMVGKVFFTIPGVGNRVCSGSVIRRFLVQTAGHCVFDNNVWVTNFIFVPGYNNGATPYGVWSSYQLFTSGAWFSSHSWCRDYGFSVMQRQTPGGNGVGDVVGYFGYTYGASTSQTWRSLGYPADPPFNGLWMYYTDSALGGTGAPGGCTPPHLGIGSDATGGTSGGPWVIGFGSTNYINSVNSWKYTAQPAAIYGPYFDSQWFTDFSTANGITPP